jgi:hypothetical protein
VLLQLVLHNVEQLPTQYILHDLLQALHDFVVIPEQVFTHRPEHELHADLQFPPQEYEQERSHIDEQLEKQLEVQVLHDFWVDP